MNNTPFIIKWPKMLEHNMGSSAMEILASSFLYSCMMWPDAKDDKNRTLYLTLCFKKIHQVLQEEEGQNADKIFKLLVDKWLGGWNQYTNNLVCVNFPLQGKGSLQDRALQASIVGRMLEYALFSDTVISISEVIRLFSAEFQKGKFPELPIISEESLMKNYWTRYKNVAHFWCALSFFTFPEPSDCIVRLDQATQREPYSEYSDGWRGIVALAHAFQEQSLSIERYKTHKPLLDAEKSLRVIFTDSP